MFFFLALICFQFFLFVCFFFFFFICILSVIFNFLCVLISALSAVRLFSHRETKTNKKQNKIKTKTNNNNKKDWFLFFIFLNSTTEGQIVLVTVNCRKPCLFLPCSDQHAHKFPEILVHNENHQVDNGGQAWLQHWENMRMEVDRPIQMQTKCTRLVVTVMQTALAELDRPRTRKKRTTSYSDIKAHVARKRKKMNKSHFLI